jgi:Plasmid pRiA4b ORF-3-like protein
MSTLDSVAVYQLRIRLDRISPLIWRRLLLTDTTTIAELHTIIQLAFGWSDFHLHRFLIHGKSYGIAYLGGMTFADDPDLLHLTDFRFRAGECFTYEYNFHVPWRHQIRLEQILSPAPGQRYPVCVGGARAAPPEECDGPHAFLALRQHYHPHELLDRLLALIGDPEAHHDPYEELRTLQYWAAINRCNRRAINRQLRHEAMATSETEACA